MSKKKSSQSKSSKNQDPQIPTQDVTSEDESQQVEDNQESAPSASSAKAPASFQGRPLVQIDGRAFKIVLKKFNYLGTVYTAEDAALDDDLIKRLYKHAPNIFKEIF